MMPTAPPPPMLTPPLIAALTPTVAMSSLVVAVTATPRKLPEVPGAMVRGPVADASAEGESHCLTRLSERPDAAVTCDTERRLRQAHPTPTAGHPGAWAHSAG